MLTEPLTAGELYQQLGVVTGSHGARDMAVRYWLHTHHLTPLLEASLRRFGHGQLLDRVKNCSPF